MISPSLTIEPAAPSDVEAIVAIEQESFASPWSRKTFEADLNENPFSRFYVARLDACPEPVGYVCFWIVFEELRLMNLAVTPSLRRRGIGRALLGRALLLGQNQGARRALLEVRASNAAALALYRETGFVQKGIRTKYYINPVEDAVLMELDPLRVPVDTGAVAFPPTFA
jgi:[ribosomal protein S18]-alanine N-acetyltransferase